MGTLTLEQYEDVKIDVPWGYISGRWYGNRAERPILAIHGWVDNLGTFDPLIPLLPDYLGILCIDLPGHGRSSHYPSGVRYSSEEYIHVIPRIMRRYGWQKVSLMGHSLGGFLGFCYTSLAPETVDMVICLDLLLPPFLKPNDTIKWIRLSQEKHLELDEQIGQEKPVRSKKDLVKLIEKESFKSISPSVAHHLLHRVAQHSETHPDKFISTRDDRVKYFTKLYLSSKELAAKMAERLNPKPFLILKGSKSESIGPHMSEVISLMGRNNPDFQFHEVEGTHHFHLLAAKECARYVVPFIRRYHTPGKDPVSVRSTERSKL
ncbi:serine hydrolase-like protein [Drosophila biarmipes]|uniref:serine hydrolase-like protein n=1 Tax=Drosophila biarmipes TaxID=125945 RepID=UPI0007E6D276|nr:serine hydrolase-like protein [Drosophila biarmipes]